MEIKSWKEFQFLVNLLDIGKSMTLSDISVFGGYHPRSGKIYDIKRLLIDNNIIVEDGWVEVRGIGRRTYKINKKELRICLSCIKEINKLRKAFLNDVFTNYDKEIKKREI